MQSRAACALHRALRRALSSTAAEYRTPTLPQTRQPLHARHATGPYEIAGQPRALYPKRRNPYKRTTALIDALQQEEGLRLIAQQRAVLAQYFRTIKSGDVLRVGFERQSSVSADAAAPLQWFTGICIAIRRRGMGSSILLRNVVQGVAVERLFPVFSPLVKHVEIIGKRRAKRAKLYYLRDKPLKESTVPNPTRPPPDLASG